jgi:hypothetical protein
VHPKRVKKATPSTPEFVSQSPVITFVMLASDCNVESDAFSCSTEPSPTRSRTSENRSMGFGFV